MALIRQSWPEYGLVFQVNALETFYVIASSLGSDLSEKWICRAFLANMAQGGHTGAGGGGERFRAEREQLKTFEGLLPTSQGQNLAFTVLHVPYSLDSSGGTDSEPSPLVEDSTIFPQACTRNPPSRGGSYLRLIDMCITSTLGWKVIKKKKTLHPMHLFVHNFHVEPRGPRQLGADLGALVELGVERNDGVEVGAPVPRLRPQRYLPPAWVIRRASHICR